MPRMRSLVVLVVGVVTAGLGLRRGRAWVVWQRLRGRVVVALSWGYGPHNERVVYDPTALDQPAGSTPPLVLHLLAFNEGRTTVRLHPPYLQVGTMTRPLPPLVPVAAPVSFPYLMAPGADCLVFLPAEELLPLLPPHAGAGTVRVWGGFRDDRGQRYESPPLAIDVAALRARLRPRIG